MINLCVFTVALMCVEVASVEITLTNNGAIIRAPGIPNPIACERVEFTPSSLNLRCDGLLFADGFEE